MQQIAKIARGVFSEELILPEHVPRIFDGGVAGRKVAMPKERELFFQRARRFNHPGKPPLLEGAHGPTVIAFLLFLFAAESGDRFFVTGFSGLTVRLVIGRRELHFDAGVKRVGLNDSVGSSGRLAFEINQPVDGPIQPLGQQTLHHPWRAAKAGPHQKVPSRGKIESVAGQWGQAWHGGSASNVSDMAKNPQEKSKAAV